MNIPILNTHVESYRIHISSLCNHRHMYTGSKHDWRTAHTCTPLHTRYSGNVTPQVNSVVNLQ